MSCLFHGVLLVWLLRAAVLHVPGQAMETAISVDLTLVAAEAQPMPVPVPEVPSVAAKPSPPAAPVDVRPVVESVHPIPRPKPSITPSAPLMAAPSSVWPEASSTASSVETTVSDTAPEAGASAPTTLAEQSGHHASAEDRDAYARLVWRLIAARKPRHVRFQGTAHLSFRLSASGDLLEAGIVQGSGMAVLDEAAVQALRDAAPFPPPPDGQDQFTIPFTFQ